MKFRQRDILIIAFALLFLLTGCKGGEAQSVTKKQVKPSKVHHSFLYYTENHKDEDGISVGDLSMQTLGDDAMDKIATDVKESDFSYLNKDNKVLFIDSENTLYEYEPGSAKEKLADDVYSYDISNDDSGIITYRNDESDLYIIKKDTDADVEKIASNVYQHELIDNDLYYVNFDGNFRKYNIEERTEEEIASNTESFVIFSKKGDLAYLNDDYFLFYRDGKNGEAKKISSETIMIDTVQFVDNALVYVGSDSDTFTLYKTELTGEMATKQVATDVRDYWYDNGAYYFVNADDNLFRKKADEDSATKLASDVFYFKFGDHGIFYEDGDNNVYTLDSEGEKKKVATDVLGYTITADGEVIYQNSNDELFVGDEKVTSDVEAYSYVYGSLVYSTNKDKLYIMQDMQEAQVVNEDLSAYHNVYYHDELVFNNELNFTDIAGVWRSEHDDFIEFKPDGTVNLLSERDKIKVEIEHADQESLTAYHEGYEEYIDITREDDETLLFDTYDDSVYLYKSSKSEADEYVAKAQEEADREEVNDIISWYMSGFSDAVNSGDSDYITAYISPTSDFYKEQSAFVEDLYDRNISEELLNYEIIDMSKVDEDTYKVTVYEAFSIYNWETGDDTDKEYKNVYTVERIDGEFLITHLKVSEN
ncbi:TcaA NTF2-like domain-containing protein [Virgibacillus sp. W0181]|uniref:TcaA NTF2-like domain-containing protein n=1 Tax=Virgibacillus sp. W0181 TaxID=3391581 RepID=UPI003F4762CD